MAEMDTGSSGGDGSDDDGTIDSGDLTFRQIAPAWLVSNLRTLKVFLSNPVGFVVGGFFAILLSGIESVTVAFLDAIFAVFDALAILPETAVSLLTDAGSVVGVKLLTAIIEVNSQLLTAAEAAGPLAGLLGTAIVVTEIIAALWVAQLLIKIAIDAIPGGGGLIS